MMSPLAIAFPIGFEEPRWLLAAAVAPLFWVLSWRSLAGLERQRRWGALFSRSLVIVLCAACLAGVQFVRYDDVMTVLYLMDRSDSVENHLDRQEEFVHATAQHAPKNDRVGLIEFARKAYLRQKPVQGGYFGSPGRLQAMPAPDRTDVGGALRLAMAMFPGGTTKRMVLMSDGNDNWGDALAEARRAKADGISIDVLPLEFEHANEVFFERMLVPSNADIGEQATLRMVLHSDKPASGTLSIFQNGQPVTTSEQDARVSLRPGTNTLTTKLPILSGGVQNFRATFRPDSSSLDANSLNNTATGFTFVAGGSSALLLSGNPIHDEPLVEALRSENVRIEVKPISTVEEFSLTDMSAYSSILLSNVPAAAFTERQLQELASYVRDLGGGLIMLGGDDSFGAGGWIGTPVEAVMPVSFEVKHKRVIPRGALVLIMHSCEVHRGNFYGKEMAKKSVDTISSQDYLGVLAYTFSSSGTSWEVPLDLNTNKPAVKARINRMQIGDMPDFTPTLQMAYKELVHGKGKDAAQKHVIIFSDGDPSPPPDALLDDFAREKITVSTVGIGWGGHVVVQSMERIAKRTGGKFYDARNPKMLPQIFTKESRVVRRPLIVEEPFVPVVIDAHSDLLTGIEIGAAIPRLEGMVLTSMKDSPHVLMPLARHTNDGNDPLLAHWQIELGKTAAFTSGYWPVWGRDWTTWQKFAKFWTQIVRWTMRQEAPANFETSTRVEGNRGRVIIDALDKDSAYLNNLQLSSRVAGPDGTSRILEFTQTGPGHYEAEFEADASGQYITSVQVEDRGVSRGIIRTGMAVPFSPEYRDLRSNEPLLRQIVEITGGRWLPGDSALADVFGDRPAPIAHRKEAWDWLLAWLVLPAFLLDVAVRRLANRLALSVAIELIVAAVLLFGAGMAWRGFWSVGIALLIAETIGWTVRWRTIRPMFELLTHTATVLGRTGESSSASLRQLKKVQELTREKTEATSPIDESGAASDGMDPSVAGAKFVASESGTPVGELHRRTAGSPAKGGLDQAAPQRAPESASEGESATSRLLKAKLRARKSLEEPSEDSP